VSARKSFKTMKKGIKNRSRPQRSSIQPPKTQESIEDVNTLTNPRPLKPNTQGRQKERKLMFNQAISKDKRLENNVERQEVNEACSS